MTLYDLILALLYFSVMSITPGPNNLMIMTSGLNYGISKSLSHYFGIVTGFPIMFFVIGMGINLAIPTAPWLHQAIRVFGIIYLFYLAYRIAISDQVSPKKPPAKPLNYWQAILFQWINPKAWMVVVSGVGLYTDSVNVQAQVVILVIIVLIASIVSAGAWLFLGVWLQKLITKRESLRRFNLLMAFLLVASMLPVIISMDF